jgi:uncharacterized iron-regulated membrane protein
MATPLRRIVAWLHAWIGALAAGFIVLIASTGLAIAFVGAIFAWQYPDILKISSTQQNLQSGHVVPDIDAMYQAAVQGYGEPIELMGLLMPGSRIDVDVAMFYGVQPGNDEVIMLGVDPNNARYTGSFELHDALGHDLIDLHSNLLAGEVGETVVAILGLLLCTFALTGVYLWWPRGGSSLRKLKNFRMNYFNAKGLFRLHSFFGIWTAILILFFSATGTMTSKPDWFRLFLNTSHYDIPAEAVSIFKRQCPSTVSLNEAYRLTASEFPQRTLAAIEFVNDRNAYQLRFKGADDLDQFEGDGIAWVHQQCGHQWASRNLTDESILTRASASMFSLHTGRSFGWIGTLMVCITCLMMLAICISGFLVWWRQYVGKKR